MADFLTTLLQELMGGGAQPALAGAGAPVPSEGGAMPGNPGRFASPPMRTAERYDPNDRAQFTALIDNKHRIEDLPGNAWSPVQPPSAAPTDPTTGADQSQGGIADILRKLFTPPDSANAPHNLLKGLLAGAPPQPPDGMDASTMGGSGAPPTAPPAAPAPPPAQQPLPQVAGTAVGAPQGGMADMVRSAMAAPVAGAPPAGPRALGGPPLSAGPPPAPAPLARPPIQPPQVAGPKPSTFVDFIRNALQGAAQVQPGMGKAQAVITGGAGAMTAQQAEAEKARAEAQKTQGAAFGQQLASAKNAREEDQVSAQSALRRARAQALANPAAGGSKSVFEAKRQAYLAVNPGKDQEALDFASGRRQMSDQEISKAALAAAQKAAQNEGLNDQQMRQRAADYERALKSGFASQGGQKSGAAAPPKPGDAVNGYRFKGGDPNDKSNWEQVK